VRLVQQMSGMAPLVLLDEVAAHLDPRRREALYQRLSGIGGQVWMTGTDRSLFDTMPEEAVTLTVQPGRVG
jgi:DNA replication and repair protein RecF